MCLWCFALLLGLSYYCIPLAQPLFAAVAEIKLKYGVWYAFFSTALFGGIIPFMYLAVSGRISGRLLPLFLFYTLFWAYKGVEVDLLYQLQAVIFGTAVDPLTVAKKVAVDQFIYGPFWAAPTMSIAMLWLESNFSMQTMKPRLNRTFFTIQIPSVLLVNMLVWLPALIVIYMMPLALQLPVSNLTLCFFVLLLEVVAKK
jgi:hypothetical protein